MLKKIMLFFAGLTLASTVTLAGDNILPYQPVRYMLQELIPFIAVNS